MPEFLGGITWWMAPRIDCRIPTLVQGYLTLQSMGGGATVRPSLPCFLSFIQNTLRQPIPENSWPCKPFCCGCPYFTMKESWHFFKKDPDCSSKVWSDILWRVGSGSGFHFLSRVVYGFCMVGSGFFLLRGEGGEPHKDPQPWSAGSIAPKFRNCLEIDHSTAV